MFSIKKCVAWLYNITGKASALTALSWTVTEIHFKDKPQQLKLWSGEFK